MAERAPTIAAPERLGRLVGAARARILFALAESRTTTETADYLGIAGSTASEHLTALVEADVLTRQREGREVRYQLNGRGRQLVALMDAQPDDSREP